MKELEALLLDFRKAVASGEYERAATVWKRYAGAVQPLLKDRRAGASQLAGARQAIDWARSVVMVANSVAADRLNALEVQRRYATPPAEARPVRHVRVSG
jgi:hypothetical protein